MFGKVERARALSPEIPEVFGDKTSEFPFPNAYLPVWGVKMTTHNPKLERASYPKF